MKNGFLLLCLFLIAVNSAAQNNLNQDYKARWEKEQPRYNNDAELNKLRKDAYTPNKPTPTYNNSKEAMENNELYKLIERNRLEKESDKKEAAEKRKSDQVDLERRQADTRAAEKARDLSTNQKVNSYVRGFMENGESPFTSGERTTLAYLCVNNKGELLATEPEVKNYLRYYKNYLEVAKSGSYDEVSATIGKFPYLNEKATEAYVNLIVRFPERKDETVRSLMKTWNTGGIPTSMANWEPNFRNMIIKYPEDFKKEFSNSSMWGKSLYYGFATVIKKERAKGPSNADSLLQWQSRFLQMATPSLIQFGMQDCLAELMDASSAEQLLELAAKVKVSPACLAMHLPYKRKYRADPDSDYPDKYYDYFLRVGDGSFGASRKRFKEPFEGYSAVYEPRTNKAFPAGDKVKYFAEKGDAESMSIYGIMILRGYYIDKKGAEAIPWLQKAAAAGAPYASLNLKDVCDYTHPKIALKEFRDTEVKGLKDYCKEQRNLPMPTRPKDYFYNN